LNYQLITGDCLEELKKIPDNSVDSIVTDPPSGIAFMGKDWDKDRGGRDNWIAWMTDVMREGLRVLKPGGHAVVWALPRTSHWTATAIEDAGFEIRDRIHYFKESSSDVARFIESLSPDQLQSLEIALETVGRDGLFYFVFGSGFPKSHNIGKAVSKQDGVDKDIETEIAEYLKAARESLGMSKAEVDNAVFGGSTRYSFVEGRDGRIYLPTPEEWQELKGVLDLDDTYDDYINSAIPPRETRQRIDGGKADLVDITQGDFGYQNGDRWGGDRHVTKPATPDAELWDGWGTAMKPSVEHWILAMKPLDGTFAENALRWGVAGLNIDGARVPTDEDTERVDGKARLSRGAEGTVALGGSWKGRGVSGGGDKGRWPANLCHDGSDEVTALFPVTGAGGGPSVACHNENNGTVAKGKQYDHETMNYGDTGSAARFFYCAKASRNERWAGCERLDSVQLVCYDETIPLDTGEVSVWESMGLSQAILAEEDIQQRRVIIASAFGTLPPRVADLCSLMCMNGRRPTGRFLMALLSITSTATNKTTASKICDWLHTWSTRESIADANCGTANGGSPATSAGKASQSTKTSGISQKRGGPSTGDADDATSRLWSANSTLDKLEERCSARPPGHPTVKSLSLMRWLVRLTKTPTGGVVLDFFSGSGSTGVACAYEDVDYIGIEQSEEYNEIARHRIEYAISEVEKDRMQLRLF
jgi:DNA modification methylase